MYVTALKMLVAQPIFGAGLGSFVQSEIALGCDPLTDYEQPGN
ncbi:hypothetical protein [Bradyrhizobium brasilense]|uniref:Uncharacterized protein n=1 Tax=Bradyrhizobium brasilense TaxID=1419277 RepID=A0ABY8JAS1_9BRAD|nr:hypothetical protein [Bradyrhizobium brasilense]WFU62586.1 hypothetical protein QA636_34800 [Bradyrhizobium brasilense]